MEPYTNRKIGRVVDRGSLENCCTARYRRFESYIFRTLIPIQVREQRRPVLLVQERNHVKSPHARWRWCPSNITLSSNGRTTGFGPVNWSSNLWGVTECSCWFWKPGGLQNYRSRFDPYHELRTNARFVYRLGHQVFILVRGVRLPYRVQIRSSWT